MNFFSKKKDGYTGCLVDGVRGRDDYGRNRSMELDHNRIIIENRWFPWNIGRGYLFDDFSLILAILCGLFGLFQYHLTL